MCPPSAADRAVNLCAERCLRDSARAFPRRRRSLRGARFTAAESSRAVVFIRFTLHVACSLRTAVQCQHASPAAHTGGPITTPASFTACKECGSHARSAGNGVRRTKDAKRGRITLSTETSFALKWYLKYVLYRTRLD